MIGTAAWVIQKKSTIEATTITQNWKKNENGSKTYMWQVQG